ncbi:DUF6706 family protein [Pedobacter jejuensis]|uniref:Uncharacterized protein n=1 Tax=Pedobacter jejuensis TaxID=1268550 RepID=A0A3N0BPJ0_9SPHI|nr:DUF6706 family protein [Pedobacter jejuensis]RNL50772.1 hypothetical protein D7004_17950 [Pedobacter jejuensis]
MTNLEAIKSVINFTLPTNTWLKVLIDADLSPTSDYNLTNERGIDLCAASLLFVILTSPDIKEGDYAQTLPSRDTLLKMYSFLVGRWNEPDLFATGQPKVTGVSPW